MDRTETEQQTHKTGIKRQVLSFLWIYLSNPTTLKKILQLDFFVLPIIQLFQLFPTFKLVQNTFWMAYLGIALILLLG